MAAQSGVYRGVSAQTRVAERRVRLVEATLAVWSDPQRRTTMTAICAEAGLTERYFYENFDGLGEALTAVLDTIAEEIDDVTTRAIEAVGDEPVARTTAALEAFVRMLGDDPRKGRVAIIEAGAMPELRARRTELLRHFAHRSAEDARTKLGLTRHSEREDQVSGLLFIGGMAELITAWLDDAIEATPEEIVAAASRSFLGLYE